MGNHVKEAWNEYILLNSYPYFWTEFYSASGSYCYLFLFPSPCRAHACDLCSSCDCGFGCNCGCVLSCDCSGHDKSPSLLGSGHIPSSLGDRLSYDHLLSFKFEQPKELLLAKKCKLNVWLQNRHLHIPAISVARAQLRTVIQSTRKLLLPLFLAIRLGTQKSKTWIQTVSQQPWKQFHTCRNNHICEQTSMIFGHHIRRLPRLFSVHLFPFWPLRMAALFAAYSFCLRWLQTAHPRMVGSLEESKQTLKCALTVQTKWRRCKIQFSWIKGFFFLPFWRNTSNWSIHRALSSFSLLSFFTRATTYLARAEGSASQLQFKPNMKQIIIQIM